MITKEFFKKIEMAHKTYRPIVNKFVNSTGKCCISGDPIKDEIFERMLCLFADWYKEQMIDKACEWLYQQQIVVPNYEEFIKDFRKEMEAEKWKQVI